MQRSLALVLALVLSAALLAACGGDSKETTAKNQVCDARDDIAKQVDTLKGLTVSAATADQIKSSLTAIGDDLRKITDAQGDLGDTRKSEVEAANKAFTTQLQGIVADFGKSLSPSQAKADLTTALQQLATTYQQTFAKVDCGS
jgi:uncharacterized membrane-anchored protein YjiN (DUF445 family)